MRTLMRKRDQRGLTLIEVMASLLIFSIVTLGVIPLLTSSIRGANIARSVTVGKNVGLQAMERIRGLPYFVLFSSQTQRVDVLDLYYPCVTAGGCGLPGQSYTASGQDTTTGVAAPRFNVVCTAVTANPACPTDIPEGYTVTFQSEFVQPAGSSPETYSAVAPPAGYVWNVVSRDLPRTRLLRITVTVKWNLGGQDRDFQLVSLLADRKFGTTRVAGSGRVEYAARVITTYVVPTGNSELVATAGIDESNIESKLLTAANQRVETGNFLLVREAIDDDTPAEILVNASGATSLIQAPPDQDPAANAAANDFNVLHPDLGGAQIGFLDDSNTSNLAVKVANELPVSKGDGLVFSPSTNDLLFWINNQAETGVDTLLHLDVSSTNPLFAVRRSSSRQIRTSTLAETASLTDPDRRVHTSATADVGRVRLFPVNFVTEADEEGATTRTVVRLNEFSATVDCAARPTGASAATATYQGLLQVYGQREWTVGTTTFAGNGLNETNRRINYDLATAAGRTNTNALSPDVDTDPGTPGMQIAGTNPMIYEEVVGVIDPTGIGSPLDVYLFPQTHDHVTDPDGAGPLPGVTTIHEHPGYLTDLEAVTVPYTNITPTLVEAQIDSAVKINTVPTDPDEPLSGLSILVGKLSCQAVDNR
jgi:prepilin-type N-terminal cleavage/methylation domain-containing protein